MRKIAFIVAILFASPAFADRPVPLPHNDDELMPLTDENGLGFDEPKRGDVIGFDKDGEPIFLGGLPQYGDDISAEVYRGTKSVPGEFPTAGWIGNCTANAVALDVVVTAGHCKGTGARINFQHRGSNKTYAATCTRHPRYNTRTVYNDYTLCKLDTPLPAGSKLVTFAKSRVARGTDMYVNGFGAPNVGTHFWGNAKISGFSGSQDLNTCGPANLGGGDSGGSLTVNHGDRTYAKGAVAVGVNSRGNSSCSWYNDYAHSEFQTWAREYEKSKGVKLCGISADCSESQPDPDPVDCNEVHEKLGSCLVSPASGCRDAYKKFDSCIKDL
jgi:hypothetical protein